MVSAYRMAGGMISRITKSGVELVKMKKKSVQDAAGMNQGSGFGRWCRR